MVEGDGEQVPSQLIAEMAVNILSSSNQAAASLKLYDASYKVLEESSTVNVTGSYDPSQVHHVVIKLDVDNQTFDVCVNNAVLLSGRPFSSSAATDVSRVELLLPSTVTEAFPSVFVLDECRVSF